MLTSILLLKVSFSENGTQKSVNSEHSNVVLGIVEYHAHTTEIMNWDGGSIGRDKLLRKIYYMAQEEANWKRSDSFGE